MGNSALPGGQRRDIITHIKTFVTKNLVDKGAAFGIVHVPVAELDQELSDFRLEYDNDGQHSHIQDHVHDCSHEPHVKSTDNHSDDVERYDSHENTHRGRTAKPPECEEDYDSEKQDVEYVDNFHLQKIECSEKHIPYYIYPRKDSDKSIKF